MTPAIVPDRLETALSSWLPWQRWFAAKDRAVRETNFCALAALPDGVVSEVQGLLAVVRVAFTDGGPEELYQLPLGIRTRLPQRLAPYVIAGLGDAVVYDATGDPELIARLLRLIAEGRMDDAAHFRVHDSSQLGPMNRPLDSRTLEVEQSNTSVVIDNRLLLKIFRRITTGTTVELEVLSALQRADSQHVPRLLGSVAGRLCGDDVAFALVQPFERHTTSGWEQALNSLRGAEAHPSRPEENLFPSGAAQLGGTVAAVHRQLAAQLPVAFLDRGGLQELASHLIARYLAACESVPQLRAYHVQVQEVFAAVADLPAPVHIQRVHGDLHLGQVLFGPRGWLVLDFEGEPAAPLPERTALTSPLKDIAGMLRSFDYAAQHANRAPGLAAPAALEEPGAWTTAMRETFLDGYAAAGAVDPRRHVPLLRAYELDKALYEVVYESLNRPTWADIPWAAVNRMTGRG